MDTPVIGLLGGGQLGRMFLESANRLNVQVNVLDKENSPAKQISAHKSHVNGSFADKTSIKELAKTCQVMTVEIEHVDTHALEEVAASVQVEPSWETLRIIQDKYAQKQKLSEVGIPVAKYEELEKNSPSELYVIANRLGYPLMLKSKTQAYDGRGNYPVKTKDDVESALKMLENRPLYAEQWANFKMELAVMVVKTHESVLSYPTVETVHEDSICKLVFAPARNISRSVDIAAQDLAKAAIATFKGKGVFGVEMFLLPDSSLLINEIAPRPHNSGHYTIEACPLSQYDACLRAILDLPISQKSLRLREPAIMLNILGGATSGAHLSLAQRALSIPGVSIHLYGKGPGSPGRKMGHLTITARTMREAESTMQPLIALADQLRSQRTDVKPPTPTSLLVSPPQPLIGIITGSHSDQPILKDCYALLSSFGIPFEKRITSAHRTPDVMAEYGRTAASRGLKVIIAAAGGAAHLPGMVAAHARTVPVIGLPIKPSIGEGWDSLVSCTNMPRGVPVMSKYVLVICMCSC